MADMEIRVGSEVSGAVQGLQQVQTELGKTSNALKQLPSVTNQATFTLNNFTRVVQDAPFGIRGIANNIDPLLESFSRLRQQTGSTSQAFKALGRIFLGPAGIALAVSTVTSLLVQFGDQLFGLSKASKEAEDANKALAASVAEELVQLTTIVGLAQNVNASQADRIKAIQLLNQEYGKYLPNLNQEAITLKNVNDKYKEIIDSLLRQAVVKGLQEEIAKSVAETAASIIKLERAKEKDRISTEKSNQVVNDSILTDNKLKQIAEQKNKTITDGVIAFNQSNAAVRANIGTTNVYDMMVKGLTDSLYKTLSPLLNLVDKFKDLNKTLDKGKDIKFDFEPIFRLRKLTIEEGRQADLFAKGNIFTKQYQDKLKKGFKALKPIKIPIKITPELQGKLKEFEKQKEEFIKNFQEDFQVLSKFFGETLTPAFDAFFKAFEENKNVGQAFFQGLSQGIKGLVQEMIKLAAISAAISLFSGGKISFGTAFKTLSGFGQGLPGRANGGPVSGGNPYLVGERGPELFLPQVSGSIIPNYAVGSFMNGGMGNSGGRSSVLRGQDILLAYARTQRSQLRVNG